MIMARRNLLLLPVVNVQYQLWMVLVTGILLSGIADAISLVETTCFVKMTFPHGDSSISIEDSYLIEQTMISYLNELFLYTPSSNSNMTESLKEEDFQPLYEMTITNYNGNDVKSSAGPETLIPIQPIQFDVHIFDSIIAVGNYATILAQIIMLYESTKKDGDGNLQVVSSQQMVNTLNNVILVQDTTIKYESLSNSYTSDIASLSFIFSPDTNDENSGIAVLKDDYSLSNDRNTSKEIALIIVTVFLSVVLCVVSFLLLYITGGTTYIMAMINNCLFVDDDDDDADETDGDHQKQQQQPSLQIQPISTFPIMTSHSQPDDEEDDEDDVNTNVVEQTVADDEEDTNFMDVQSAASPSVLPMPTSGRLGVQRHPQQRFYPEHNIETDNENSTIMYGDGMTPISRPPGDDTTTPFTYGKRQHHGPLGIMSMRKMPRTDDTGSNNKKVGGFSNMMTMTTSLFGGGGSALRKK